MQAEAKYIYMALTNKGCFKSQQCGCCNNFTRSPSYTYTYTLTVCTHRAKHFGTQVVIFDNIIITGNVKKGMGFSLFRQPINYCL